MKSLRKPTKAELEKVQTVLRNAELLLGYIENPGMNTSFGKTTGYNSQPWAGSFIDVLFHTSDVAIPACVYPPSALSEFIRLGRFHVKNPRVGDIVFFSVPTGHNIPFAMPHCGLLADISGYEAHGQVGTVEGHTSSGLARAQSLTPGVYRRVRPVHEIIGFGRPAYKSVQARATSVPLPQISLDNVRAPRRNPDIGLVQRALAVTVDLNPNHITVDLYDRATSDAYAHWQRTLGYVGPDANGLADLRSLTTLGKVTGLFTVEN